MKERRWMVNLRIVLFLLFLFPVALFLILLDGLIALLLKLSEWKDTVLQK